MAWRYALQVEIRLNLLPLAMLLTRVAASFYKAIDQKDVINTLSPSLAAKWVSREGACGGKLCPSTYVYAFRDLYYFFWNFYGLDNFSIFDLVRQGKTTRGWDSFLHHFFSLSHCQRLLRESQRHIRNASRMHRIIIQSGLNTKPMSTSAELNLV